MRAVLSGAKVTEVAAAAGVSRQSVHTWVTRYLAEGLAGLADRSHRPRSCPHQVAGDAEVAVAEMRRQHPKWGAKRIRLVGFQKPPCETLSAVRPAGRDPRRALPTSMLGSSLGFIDSSVINVALPKVKSELDVGCEASQWVANEYLLTLQYL